MRVEPQIVFDSGAIRVLFLPGPADRLLITFGDAAELAGGAQFFAEPVARGLGWPCLAFMAKDAHWYPEAEIEAALPSIRYTLTAFAEKTVYGCSMGAYAAIKFSAILGARHVIAYCPQYSIDPAELAGARSGYEGYFQPNMRGMAIRPRDVAGKISVFFDPYEAADALHGRLIKAAVPDARLFHVPNVGHHLAPVLAGTLLTQGIFEACARDDTGGVYRLINGARRASPWRQQHVLQRAARRHIKLVAQALQGLLARRALFIPDSANVAPPLFHALLRAGEPELAYTVLRKLRPVMSAPRAQLIARDLEDLSRGEPWLSAGLLTAHDTLLVYDALTARFEHIAPARDRLAMVGKHRVMLCKIEDMLRLAVRVRQQLLFCCAGLDDEPVVLLPLTEATSTAGFSVHEAKRSVRVSHGGAFLHATPDGRVYFEQTGPALWQRLSPV
jgi:hypothetical protein